MADLNQEDAARFSSPGMANDLPRLPWLRLLTISIFAFALQFHWSALSTIILPSQVYKMVGNLEKGTALAYVLVPGAFVSLFANPLFGWLSDRTQGRLAAWGRRRPYILVGTLLNIAVLAWMATAHDIFSLALAYVLIQLFSNAVQAPFHALLPDIVPSQQRGMASGMIGLLGLTGYIGGVLFAGELINSSQPLAVYQRELWIVYGLIMLVMLALMLVTIFTVSEPVPSPESDANRLEKSVKKPGLSRSLLITLAGMLAALLLVWGLMTLWNSLDVMGIQLNNTIQQVVLEVLATGAVLWLFDFRPRRYPDFSWVLLTRMVMMLGIYTIQTFLQYYMSDVVKAANPIQETTTFLIIVSLFSLGSSFVAGWLSDRFGRKRLVYISGFLMALVGMVFVVTHSLILIISAGAIFGLGYGAYQSVDWALVADVLPSNQTYARDMGVWNIALSLPQVIAPVLGGPIIDSFNRAGHPVQGYQLLFCMAILYCLIGTVTVRFIRGVKE